MSKNYKKELDLVNWYLTYLQDVKIVLINVIINIHKDVFIMVKRCKCKCPKGSKKRERFKTDEELLKKIEELKKRGYEMLPDSKYDIY